jgi:hypothetical protein
MTKLIGVLAAVALLALPGTALAKHGNGNGNGRGAAARAAVQQCNQERSRSGKPAFQQKYGRPHAFRNCVRQHLAADRAAAQACRGERKAMGVPAFRQKYGTPNALVRCVRAKTG